MKDYKEKLIYVKELDCYMTENAYSSYKLIMNRNLQLLKQDEIEKQKFIKENELRLDRFADKQRKMLEVEKQAYKKLF